MTLTFTDAIAKAQTLSHDWKGPGTFDVAPYGYENDVSYLVITGAREVLDGSQPELSTADDQQVLVDKRTGIISRTTAQETQGDNWREVGNWDALPAEPDEITLT